MNYFVKKEYLSLKMPSEDLPISDQQRILLALESLGYKYVYFPLSVIRKLYPLCRNVEFDITVTLVHREYDWVVANIESGDTTSSLYGLAVDYGSTTIIMQLVDLITGNTIFEEKEENGQIQYGTDILTRIVYTMENDNHVKDLHKATIDTLHKIMDRLTAKSGIDILQLPLMILSGNTTMIHFLLELNAWTVFASPYAPVTTNPGFLWGNELGMDFQGLIYTIPAASNYVGGDIISGLLTLDIHKQDQPQMFFDIGTNGELVIGNNDWMISGAGAAGPALEGYISRFGMRAAAGAIDHVKIIDNELSYTTIDNIKPIGICGSGIIDLLAQMRIHGWINIAGKLETAASSRIIYHNEEEQYVVIYAYAKESGIEKDLYFSQLDIDQYLDTKAAAYTMIDCLLDYAGISAHDLGHCYLSGAFSAHSDLESAITIGIFPDLERIRYSVLKNSSLEGAKTLLLNHTKLAEANTLVENMYCVQFASIPDFLIKMQAAKFIPHTDMKRYPSIINLLKKSSA